MDDDPIVIAWDDAAHSVVLVTMREGWTWNALYARNHEVVEMMRSTDARVHLIIDCAFRTIPLEGVMTHAHNVLSAYPPNCDMRVIVGYSTLVERLVGVFQVTFRSELGRNVYLVGSLDAARAMIRVREYTNTNAP